MSKRPPPQRIHVKQRRPQGQFFGDLTPSDLRHHDRKMTALRRAEGINDTSLEVVARRLAGAFPLQLDPEPYRKVISYWLDRGENARRRNLSKLGKKALSHQKAIAMLHGLLDGKLPGAEDLRWLKERFAESNPELADSIDVVCACATTTSEHLASSDEGTCYTLYRVDDVGLYRPLIGRSVITQPIPQVVVPRDPDARKAFFESLRPLLGKELFDSTFANPEGLEPHEQYGSKSLGFSVRVEPVFLPGNETVMLDGSDDYLGVHSLSRDGKWTEEIADTGDPGLQRPGEDELRVGPRTLIKARNAADKFQVSTTTPPTFSVTPCGCAACTGAPKLTWRVAHVEGRHLYLPYRLVEAPQLPGRGYDCRSIEIRKDVRWRQRGRQQWLRRSPKTWSTPTLIEVAGVWSAPSLVELGPLPGRPWTPMTEEQMRGRPLADGRDHGLKHQLSLLFQNPGEMAAAEQRQARMSSWHWWIATNNAAELKLQTT
jgi:hypothetical protein